MFDVKKITIKGKEYEFLSPKAVQVIRLEDSCMTTDGETNIPKLVDGHLKFVKRDLGIEMFDAVDKDNVLKVGEKKFTLKDMTMKTKLTVDALLIKGGNIDRIGAVAGILSICEEEVSVDDLSYNEINGLLDAYNDKMDSEEVMDVFAKIKTFL